MTDRSKSSRLTSTLRAAVHRRRLQLIIYYISRALILSLLTALLLLIAQRIFAVPLPDILIIITSLLGLPLGMWLAFRRTISPLDTAVILDNTYHLKNRVSSALDLTLSSATHPHSHNPTDPVSSAFNELTHLDAERACDGIEIKNAFPLTWLRASSRATVLCALLIAGIIWCPDLSPWFINNDQNQQLIARRNKELAAAQAIREAEQNLRDLKSTIYADNATADKNNTTALDQTQQVLKTLNDLSLQLTANADKNNTNDTTNSSSDDTPPEKSPPGKSPPDPRQTVTQAAQTLNELARQLDDSAEENQHIADSLLKRLNRITPPAIATQPTHSSENGKTPESTIDNIRELARALKQNDTEKAVQEVNRLQQLTKRQSPQENQKLAQELRKLAEQIQPEQPDSTTPANTNKQSSTASPPQNNPAPANKFNENTSPEQQIKQETSKLEKQGLDPETAQKQAEKQHQQNLTKQAEKKADEELNKTSEELRRWADELQNKKNTPRTQQPNNETTKQLKKNSASNQTNKTNPENTPKNQTNQPTNNNKPESQPDQQSQSDNQQRSTSEKNTGSQQTTENKSPTPKTNNNQPAKNQPGENQPQNAVAPTPDDNQNNNANNVATNKEDQTGKPKSSENSAQQQRRESSEQSSKQSSQQSSQQPSQQPVEQPSESQQSNRSPQPSETKQEQKQQQTQQGNKQQRQSQPQQTNDNQSSDDDNQPQTKPSQTVRRLQDALRRMGSHEKQTDQHRTVSEEAKKQAQKLIEKMTPNQRKELKRWAEQQTPHQTPDTQNAGDKATNTQSPTNGNTDNQSATAKSTSPPNKSAGKQSPYRYDIRDIDARSTNANQLPASKNDRVLSEWLSDTPRDGTTTAKAMRRNDRQLQPTEIKQATRAARRALDEEAVAPRYRELLKKWTDQLAGQLRKIKNNKSENGKPSSSSDSTKN